VPEPSAFKVETAVEELKSHKSSGIDQILAELIKIGGRKICFETHKLISIWNKEESPKDWKESIIVPNYKKGNKTDCGNYRGIPLLPTVYTVQQKSSSLKFQTSRPGSDIQLAS
jgi:hypothetical protein